MVTQRIGGTGQFLLSRLDEMGIHGKHDLLPDFLECMLEYLIEQNTLAAYLPGACNILVILENVDDSNRDSRPTSWFTAASAWHTVVSFRDLRSCVEK